MDIKDCWYAVKVCKKYGITWNPFYKLDRGGYRFWPDGYSKPVIFVNPLSKNFMEIFFHEVGHCVAKKLGHYDRQQNYLFSTPKDDQVLCQGHPYRLLLDEEAFASRFARKALKSCNTEYLVKCFQTYTRIGYKSNRIDSVDLTDQVSKLIKRIEK